MQGRCVRVHRDNESGSAQTSDCCEGKKREHKKVLFPVPLHTEAIAHLSCYPGPRGDLNGPGHHSYQGADQQVEGGVSPRQWHQQQSPLVVDVEHDGAHVRKAEQPTNLRWVVVLGDEQAW